MYFECTMRVSLLCASVKSFKSVLFSSSGSVLFYFIIIKNPINSRVVESSLLSPPPHLTYKAYVLNYGLQEDMGSEPSMCINNIYTIVNI